MILIEIKFCFYLSLWGVLHLLNQGCFVQSRYERYHYNAENINQGVHKLAQNSANLDHPLHNGSIQHHEIVWLPWRVTFQLRGWTGDCAWQVFGFNCIKLKSQNNFIFLKHETKATIRCEDSLTETDQKHLAVCLRYLEAKSIYSFLDYQLPVILMESPVTPGHVLQIVFVLLATIDIYGNKATSKQVGRIYIFPNRKNDS